MSNYIFEVDKAHPSVWIAQGAIVVGDVHLGQDVSIWFNAVIRGDTETIHIAERTNIQDLSMIHADPNFPTIIGADCTIGHRAIIHGATVGHSSLIGMGAILLNGAQIGAGSIVGAGALVTQGKIFPPRSLILGSPAKVVRQLSDGDVLRNKTSSAHYVYKSRQYQGKD